jgi:hypothetical protein
MPETIEAAKPGTLRYRLISTGSSSERLGDCEVCGEHVSEVFRQVEERFYSFVHNGEVSEGWTQHECRSFFGHEACLLKQRR